MAERNSTPGDREPASISRRGFLAAAVVLMFLAVLSQFRLVRPAASTRLEVRPLESISTLAERRDLNLLFVVIDTLRSDRLGAYGYERDTSPRIDALASRGIRFAEVEAQSSWTKASMASLWTSRLPERIGITRIDSRLPDAIRLPAEVLHEDGFRTIGLWRNGWVGPSFGFDQGFDVYVQPVAGRDARMRRQEDPKSMRLSGSDLDLAGAAVEFLRGVGEERFFLYAHFMDVHQYVSSVDSPSYGTQLGDLYDASIHWTDQNVGRLIDALAENELLDKTWIVIASDHGESLGEAGREGHARTLHHETQSTPLIIAPPFALAEPHVVADPISNLDIWPTLYPLLGVGSNEKFDGVDRVPAILGRPTSSAQSESIAQLDLRWGIADGPTQEIASLKSGSLRLIWHRGEPGRSALFDTRADRDEGVDLSREEPARVLEMQTRLAARLERARGERDMAPERVDLGADQAAQLRALGYSIPGAAAKSLEAQPD